MKRVLQAMRRSRPEEHQKWPEVAILFVEVGPKARRALEMFPGEARAWRSLAEREAVRARELGRDGRVWDAGVCAGRAEAYRVAAEHVENVLIEAFDLWEQYERQVGEGL